MEFWRYKLLVQAINHIAKPEGDIGWSDEDVDVDYLVVAANAKRRSKDSIAGQLGTAVSKLKITFAEFIPENAEIERALAEAVKLAKTMYTAEGFGKTGLTSHEGPVTFLNANFLFVCNYLLVNFVGGGAQPLTFYSILNLPNRLAVVGSLLAIQPSNPTPNSNPSKHVNVPRGHPLLLS